MGVLPARRLRSEESPQSVAVGRGRVLPIGPDGIPTVAESLSIGVTVLRNDPGNSLGMPRSQSKTSWGSVIKHVDRKSVEPHYFGKAVDDARDVVKGVFELTWGRHIRLTE